MTTATVILTQEHIDADDQHQGLPARPGEAAAEAHAGHDPRHGGGREAAAEEGVEAVPAGRAAGGQRPQTGDGRLGAADHRPHDRVLPRRAGLRRADLPQVRAHVTTSTHRPVVGDGAGPRRHAGGLLQPQQGILAAGLGSGDRAVLRPWPDAARLRRAHVPPPDHAGGVHPHAAVGLRRAHRQGGLAGDGQRLGGQRREVPVPPGRQGTDPRHRLGGVHGPRARHRPRTGDHGQPGLHHDHSRRQRDRAQAACRR